MTGLFVPEVPGVIDYVQVDRIRIVETTDPYGDTTRTEERTQLPKSLFEPEQSTERTDRRTPGVTVPAKLYVPPPGELRADDIVEIAGQRWQVDGKPARWGNVGTEAALKRYGPTSG